MHGSWDVPSSHHPRMWKRYPGLARRKKQAAMRRSDGLPGILLMRTGIDQVNPGIYIVQRLLNLTGHREQMRTGAWREPGWRRPQHLLMPIEAQRPPVPGCLGVIRLGAGDHARLVPDARRFHDRRERLGRQEQVLNSTLICPAQITLPIEMNGSRKMSLLVQLPARPIAEPSGIYNAHITIHQVGC